MKTCSIAVSIWYLVLLCNCQVCEDNVSTVYCSCVFL